MVGRTPLPGFRAITPDLPGFGEAAVRPWAAGPLGVVLAVAPERFALVEISFGGAVALRVAAVAPSRRARCCWSRPRRRACTRPRAVGRFGVKVAGRGDFDTAAVAVAEARAPPRLRR